MKGREWGRERRAERAGDDGGNHGYKDGGQTEDTGQEEERLPAVGAVLCLGPGSPTDPPEEELKRASAGKSWDERLH